MRSPDLAPARGRSPHVDRADATRQGLIGGSRLRELSRTASARCRRPRENQGCLFLLPRARPRVMPGAPPDVGHSSSRGPSWPPPRSRSLSLRSRERWSCGMNPARGSAVTLWRVQRSPSMGRRGPNHRPLIPPPRRCPIPARIRAEIPARLPVQVPLGRRRRRMTPPERLPRRRRSWSMITVENPEAARAARMAAVAEAMEVAAAEAMTAQAAAASDRPSARSPRKIPPEEHLRSER